jgi:sugar lactone lactonase YvrE
MRLHRVRKAIFIIGILGFISALEAVVPRKWELRTKDDFLKGKLDGVSVSYEGVLSLAPREDKLEGPAEDFYLSFQVGQDGAGYLGTGHGGKIYRIGPDGKSELFYQAQEMDVTCLAMDGKGVLFAGTSPNGKVYKITGKDQGQAFFNPGEKYIWDLASTADGFLMAAVGETGGIYKVNAQGEGQRVLKAEENHVLCLLPTNDGGFLAGSGGVGVIYRLGADGRVSVLFESPYEEIKSLATDGEGNIYAACGGAPSRTKREEPAQPPVRVAAEVTVTASASAPSSGAAAPAAPLPSGKEPGALFRVRPDGIAKRLWESEDELIYSLLWTDAEKRLLFGTGGKGRIYTIDRDERTSLLLQGGSEQVYALEPAGTKVYVLSDNPSRLSLVSAEQRFNGEYIGDVLDARTVSAWGRLEFDGQLPAGSTIQIQTRSGNAFEPNSMWSDWSPPIQKQEEQILSPKSRYLQVKVLFKTQSGNASPSLRRLTLFYLQANIAPVVQKLDLLPPNQVYLKPPEQEEVIWGVDEAPAAREESQKDERSLYLAKKVERKGFQTVTWEAADDNGDRLLYSIAIRKEGETAWRPVKGEWPESIFVFDTLSYPDGVYYVRLSASDLSSNPPGSELESEKTSPPLVIDNSLPVVKTFNAVRTGNSLDVAFQAEDSFSSIEEVEYLIRPGQWRVVFPVDGVCDSRTEGFKFRVALPGNAENLVTVRVTDRHHNVGVYRQVF